MAARIFYEKDTMTVFLDGEIDHHSAAIIRAGIDEAILASRPGTLVLDFGGITFMDSSGIGLVMGRYRLLRALGGELVMTNLPESISKVMRLAGLEKLGRIEEREVTV
ncbi:MAG: STAS domain-containing protein [Ruminococcaceae bacterium]|nr:STAS domain-containing protein [Oscillospiraceae bacterium]MBQ6873059.1 anti-sigma factor antagonist [Clostridia bacterium]